MTSRQPAYTAAYTAACTARAQQSRLRTVRGHVYEDTCSATPLEPVIRADFSHNDYLGLSHHPLVLQAAGDAAMRWGAGATGSRLLSGDYDLLADFEQEIAQGKGTEAALIFVSGYQANATALAALLDSRVLGAQPLVFSDRLNHASLHHACRLAGLRQQRYHHCDLNHLESLLQKSAAATPKFIISETVFGMDGDRVDVIALAALAKHYGAFLYLDDAHATGLFGAQGYGLGSHLHGQDNTVVMGTFSKALGASGAYLACSKAVARYLINYCTGFIYSTAPAPAAVAAARASWQLLPTLAETRRQLLDRAAHIRARLQAQGFSTGNSDTQIIPILVGEDAPLLVMQKKLRAQGIKVSAVRPPTVPPNTARLRVALSALHTSAQIDALLEGLSG